LNKPYYRVSKKMAWSHPKQTHELEASNAASSHKQHKPEPMNPRMNPWSRPSLIPQDYEPEFNLKYLQFAY